MKAKIAAIATLVILGLTIASLAGAGEGTLINFVDTPATLHYSRFGEAPLRINGDAILDIGKYRKVSILVGTTKAKTMEVTMGKIRNATLAQVFPLPKDLQIHTFDVVGPHLGLWFKGGPPDTTENVQLWLYLTE